MWCEINNEADIKELMDVYGGFHDSCIKCMEYISGAYVSPDLSMHALNDLRQLRIVVERQRKAPKTIELVFGKLRQLILMPDGDEHTCEILEAAMYYKKQEIIWQIGVENGCEEGKVLVCAQCARWRVLE